MKSSRIYIRFYQPKKGLVNRVFEVNTNFLNKFYQPPIG